jgi:hypothetical protein
MGNVSSVAELNASYPGVSEILGLWFSNYKGVGGGVQSNGLIDSDPWAVLDTKITLFGQFYPEGVKTPKRSRSFFLLQVTQVPGNRAVIGFSLDRKEQVVIDVHSVAGRKIASLVDGTLAPGKHTIIWQTTGAAPGCYLVKLRTGNNSAVKRIPLY